MSKIWYLAAAILLVGILADAADAAETHPSFDNHMNALINATQGVDSEAGVFNIRIGLAMAAAFECKTQALSDMSFATASSLMNDKVRKLWETKPERVREFAEKNNLTATLTWYVLGSMGVGCYIKEGDPA